MPDPVTGTLAVGTTIGSALISSRAMKKADKTQQRNADANIALQKEMYEKQLALGEPYRQFGEQYLPMLGDAMQPINREIELSAYYSSPEYAMMSDQARNQQLASSEATGGLGSTSTSNTLGAIAPQLGQQYLAMREGQQTDLYNRLMGGVNVGLSGTGIQHQATGQFGSNAGNIMSQSSANKAQSQLAQGQLWSNTLSGLGGMSMQQYGAPLPGGRV